MTDSEPIRRPMRATFHCRHYAYVRGSGGGPMCGRDVELSAVDAPLKCLPEATGCQLREEYTAAERAAWHDWEMHRREAMVQIIAAIPGSSRNRRHQEYWGKSGDFGCPVCSWGVVKWSRSSRNGHLAAACTTPDCFSVIE